MFQSKLWVATLLLSACLIFSCNDDDDGPLISLDDSQLIVKQSSQDVDLFFSELETEIVSQGLMLVESVDHGAAAAMVNLSLRPTKLAIFGNPQAGTQLMQTDQRIGIDLPLKILVWQDDDNETQIGYYNATTLTQRYAINGMDQLIGNINATLDNLSGTDLGDTPDTVDPIVDEMVVKNSSLTAAVAFANLETEVLDRGLNVVAKVEHDQAAASIGMSLRPTKVIIFGNPEVGTQLMQSNQKIGIDLPLKMLVWEDVSGQTKVGYYPAETLTDRYDISGQEDIEDTINGVLAALSDAVTQ